MSAAKAAESPEIRAAVETDSPAAEMDPETGQIPVGIMEETPETVRGPAPAQEIPGVPEAAAVPAPGLQETEALPVIQEALRAAAPRAALQVDPVVQGAPAAVREALQAAAPQAVREAPAVQAVRAAVQDHPEVGTAVRAPEEEPIRRGRMLQESGRSQARSIILQDRMAMAFWAEERETASAEAERK